MSNVEQLPHATTERDADWFARRDQLRDKWMRGHPGAIAFLVALGDYVETWDDLIDNDTEVAAETINYALLGGLLYIACNPFVAENHGYLMPLFVQCYGNWKDSDTLARNADERVRMVAFHLRNCPLEFYSACAYLVGGMEWRNKVGPEMREFFATERFEDWEYYNG